jgi:Holliday junction resolvase
MIHSRGKGAHAERELLQEFLRAGVLCQRTAQYCGKGGTADVICRGMNLHIEVKRTEKLRLTEAIAQVERDRHGKPWVIAYRANRMPWLILQPFSQWHRDSLLVLGAKEERLRMMRETEDA